MHFTQKNIRSTVSIIKGEKKKYIYIYVLRCGFCVLLDSASHSYCQVVFLASVHPHILNLTEKRKCKNKYRGQQYIAQSNYINDLKET